MSNRYPFSGERSFTQGGTMVWSDQVAVQPSLDFSVSDSTLTDSINDSYTTVVEDNETQYLSVLETTNDITLDDLQNINLENHKVTQDDLQLENIDQTENSGINSVDPNDQQVIVFSVDGSDDLYGIQLMQDEAGNMQKYQFKFRTTEDGQLEAIPESIQLLESEVDPQENIQESEALAQEETEVVDTQVIYQEHTDIQENLVFEEHEEEISSENVEEKGTVQMFIKGEPETEIETEGSADSDVYMEGTLEEGVLGEDPIIQYEENEMEDQSFEEEETVDIKAGILEENSVSANIKEEIFHEDSQQVDDADCTEEEYSMYNQHHIDIKPLQFQNCNEEQVSCIQEGNIETDDNYVDVGESSNDTILEYQNYDAEEIQHVYEETDTNDSHVLEHIPEQDQFDKVFIKEHAFRGLSEVEQGDDESRGTYYTEAGVENESDNEDYQIVEGLHITAEGDIAENHSLASYQEPDTILQEVVEKPSSIIERANILKQPSLVKAIKESKIKNSKTLVYYVVPHVEKENVNSLSVNYTAAATALFRPIRSNPRSILKSSYPELRKEPEVKNAVDERFSKRFARSKEAVQARLFNNFISKTTIPHAPVRNTRLPRKQQIKPVDNRRDEEIIVQEVMVGSNGFIENIEDKLKNKDKLEVTQYVVLSDSDEDYDPKKGNKRKKRYKKHKRTYMDSSEDSDTSVIEIPSGDEEIGEDQQENPKRGRGRPKKTTDLTNLTDIGKRRRGRPPKSSTNHSDSEESPQKKVRTETDESDNHVIKKEHNCPHCTKTFPSLNSLSTHLHHHNLENSLRNSQAKGNSKTIEYKYKCEICQMNFKNSVLLKRHVCPKQTKKTSKRLECSVCKKSFPDVTTLEVHKRSHVKENLVNTTVLSKVSPKKSISRPSTNKLRSPKKHVPISKSTFKCQDCSRMCFSQESLDLHEKTHRKFRCSLCGTAFPSRLLLDTHIRVSCVKGSPKPNNRRLSFKIKKAFVQSPLKKSLRLTRKSNIGPNLDITSSTSNFNLECEQCGEKFTTFRDRFKHQVKMHGLETPDKSVLAEQKKRLHKPKALHGGIPAREGMRKVFANIRSQIALLTPQKGAD